LKFFFNNKQYERTTKRGNSAFCLTCLSKEQTMSVLKVIEVLSNSKKSWEDATVKGVEKVAKTLRNVRSAHVQTQSVVVENGKVTEFRVNLKVSFEIE
jgi:flavin-binding protein dodecin